MDDFDRGLGERLRAARRRRGWSLNEVERRSGQEFKSSVLGAYERGERSVSVQRLRRLAGIYMVEVARLIPPTAAEQSDETVIDLTALATADESVFEAVDRFLSAIQTRRRSPEGDLTVRQADIDFLAALVRADRATVRRVISEFE